VRCSDTSIPEGNLGGLNREGLNRSTDGAPTNAVVALPSPRMTWAQAPLVHGIDALDERGEVRRLHIPAERPLTLYVNKRELVTLMTLGSHPELLVLGYLRNQRLVESVSDVDSITVDWDIGAAAVRTRTDIVDWTERTARKVVTSGCGQGSVFARQMEDVQSARLPVEGRVRQSELVQVLARMRLQDSTYKAAGSVHGCALFRGTELLMFVEDVGRHNAIDTLAAWMWLHADPDQPNVSMTGADKLFYTTGRLTSEMVMKAANMGVPVLVSRSGTTQMGHAMATQLGMCTIGRALNRHFLCYSGHQRLVLDALPSLGNPETEVSSPG
jgi:FdhD protein